MDFLLTKTFNPTHADNKMKQEGDVAKAREYFIRNKNKNLAFLLDKRYSWMNDYITNNDLGIEVGAGCGFSKFFIKNKNLLTTDYANHSWLDAANINALELPYPNESKDYIIAGNMIHHIPYPLLFFKEMARVLKPGGVLIIQELYGSYLMRLILKLMRHEGYDYTVNVWNEKEVCTNPNDLWAANCVIPNLLFDNTQVFQNNVPQFKIIKKVHTEFFVFLNSGGVIAKTGYLPLPKFALKFLWKLDSILSKVLPSIFSSQVQLVLKKWK